MGVEDMAAPRLDVDCETDATSTGGPRHPLNTVQRLRVFTDAFGGRGRMAGGGGGRSVPG